MKVHAPKDPAEKLCRRTLQAGSAMVLSCWALTLSLSVLGGGEKATSLPELPMTKPGIGKNVEIIARNVSHNTVAEAAANTVELIGWIGVGLSLAVGAGSTGVLIAVAAELDPSREEKKAAPIKVAQLIPTSELGKPPEPQDLQARPESPHFGGLPDFAATIHIWSPPPLGLRSTSNA